MTESLSELPRTTWNVYKDDTKEIKKIEDTRDLSQPEVFRFLLRFYRDKGRFPDKKEDWEIFLRDQISKKEIYTHLRDHPDHSKFMFKKYTDQQNFIRELCDPENPIHVPEVFNQLKEKFEIEGVKENLSEMKSRKIKLQNEINKLSSEIDQKSSELFEIENRLDPMKIDMDVLEKQVANIRSDEGLTKILKFIEKVKSVATTIIEGSPELHILKERKLDRNQLQLVENLRDLSSELPDYLSSNDFISEAKLDEQRKELLEQIKKVSEENKVYANENIGKNSDKVIETLLSAISPYLDTKGSDVISGYQMGRLVGIIQDSIRVLEKSKSRYDNLKRNSG